MKVILWIALGFVLQVNAQIAQVVSVIASDPEAREISPLLDIPENPAVFQVWRHGPTNGPLTVLLNVGGTASNGVDYEFLANSITIPAGSFFTEVFVSVIDDQLVEGTETVVLTLQPSPCLSCYEVGSNATAVAYILDDEATNAAPIIWISRPHDGESFVGPTNILLRAVAHDPEDGYDLSVDFFSGDNRIGAATFIPSLCPEVDCPSWDLIWSNVPPGTYTLRAKATDKAGAMTVSAPVHITVVSTNPPPERTVIGVVAIDPEAREPGISTAADPGQFAIWRAGNLGFSIPVSFWLGGSAANGVDYTFISNYVVIPAGATQVLVNVVPLQDNLAEGTETVILGLLKPGCVFDPDIPPPPTCYQSSNTVASVFIADAPGTNHLPFVQLNQPREGDVFTALTDIHFQAYAQDAEDGNDLKVEFFAGTNRLGEGVFVPTLCPSPYCPFFALTWSNVPPGHYTLMARATDKMGAIGVSTPVHITVGPTTNLAPTVAITAPTNSAVIPAGTDVHIEAVTEDADGYADTVTFFADNHPIGEVTILFIQAPPPGSPIQFGFTWTNPPPGGHILTAATVDALGARGTSAPVHIFVTAETNPPPDYTVVTVVALDSHAQEPGGGAVDTGQFAIRRTANLSNDVTVFFGVGGSASNGLDYVAISNRVVIPAGATQAVVNIEPLGDALVEGTETVVLELHPPVCAAIFPPPPGCYAVGWPGRAAVFIADASAPTNRPPIVELINPPDASIFPALADILLVAHANDPDGYETVRTVEFFAGSNSLGLRTNYPTANPIGPFFLIWSNVSAGNYVLTARATDSAGASATSAPIHVRVVDVTGTNRPPIWPWPRLRIPPQCLAEVRTNGCRLLLGADTPMTCVLESTVDLLHWTPLCTNTLSGGEIELRDCQGSGAPMRFYRVRQE